MFNFQKNFIRFKMPNILSFENSYSKKEHVKIKTYER